MMEGRGSILYRMAAFVCLAGAASGYHPAVKAGGEPEIFQAAPRKMQLFSLFPTGARRGTSADVEVLGANLDGLQRVDVSCPGVHADVLSSTYLSARVRFKLDPGAAVGLCRLRMFSRIGASNLEVFRVGELPEQAEREPNDSPATAQSLLLPCVVDGRLYPDEDVDFYLVKGAAGEQLTAEVLAAVNGSGLNPEIYLLDASGMRLAVGVNEESSDPVLRYRFTQDGEYRLAVRGTFGALNISFPTGHPAYVYQLRVATGVPQVEFARPFDFTAEKKFQMRVTGDGLSAVDSLVFSDPAMKATIVEHSSGEILAQIDPGGTGPGVRQMWAVAGSLRSSPVNLLVTAKPDRLEAEPRHSIEKAAELALGDAVAGQISNPGDVDYYGFQAP